MEAVQVPLVIYTKNAKRLVVGKAQVEADGKITAVVASDMWGVVRSIFEVGRGEFSIAPGPPPDPILTRPTLI